MVEKSAHKRSKQAGGPAKEWEEKWWERYDAAGGVRREADKWGREGAHVWHERHGDYFDSRGAVSKWTDKVREQELASRAFVRYEGKWKTADRGEGGIITSNSVPGHSFAYPPPPHPANLAPLAVGRVDGEGRRPGGVGREVAGPL